MGKPGRKRKAGPREPNGKLQRSTMARLNDAAEGGRRKMQEVVLMQPHRGGRVGSTTLVRDIDRVIGFDGRIVETSIDNRRPAVIGTDQEWAGSVFGRFCYRERVSNELFRAGEAYGRIVSQWRSLRGVPVTCNKTSGPPPSEPETEEEKKERERRNNDIRRRFIEAERELIGQGTEALLAVRQLIVDEYDVAHEQVAPAILGLGALAKHLGMLGRHPFPRA